MRNQNPQQNQRPRKSKLRELREKEGLTLIRLANAINVNYTCLSRLERHTIRSLPAAKKLVDFFGRDKITLEEILYPGM